MPSNIIGNPDKLKFAVMKEGYGKQDATKMNVCKVKNINFENNLYCILLVAMCGCIFRAAASAAPQSVLCWVD